MRYIYIALLILSVSGCVNYIGIHEHSAPYTATDLAVRHDYTLPTPMFSIRNGSWWEIFKDQQLNELITTALECSPDMQIAQNRLQRARHIAEAAGASLWPTIDFNGYIRREHFSKNYIYPPPLGGSTRNVGNLSVNLNYDIDFWGKNRETVAANVSEAQAALADLAEARLMISSAVASSYFQLRYDLALLELLKTIVRERQELLKLINLRASHSLTSVIPVGEAQIQVNTWELLVAQTQQYIEIQKQQLAVLMGDNPLTTQFQVKKFSYQPKLLTLPPILPSRLLERRPDIAASRWRVEAAKHWVHVEKALFFPDVNLMAFFSFQSIGLNKLFSFSSRDYAIQAAFYLPIFDADYLRSSLKERYDEYDAAVNQYNQTILTALQQVANGLSSLYYVKVQIDQQSQAEAIAKNNYHRNYLLYQHGINDYTQVLVAQASWFYQQLFLWEFEILHIQATITMIHALGGDYG